MIELPIWLVVGFLVVVTALIIYLVLRVWDADAAADVYKRTADELAEMHRTTAEEIARIYKDALRDSIKVRFSKN